MVDGKTVIVYLKQHQKHQDFHYSHILANQVVVVVGGRVIAPLDKHK